VAVIAPVGSPDDAGAAPKADHEVVMLVDFFDELPRKVPVGK